VDTDKIAYAARVNAAYHLIRNARKISRRLADTTSEQQQAIENEIAVIGMRLHSETRDEHQPEATYHPGEDHELEDYIAAVLELVPDANRYVIQCYHKHKYTPQQCAEKWLAFVSFTEQQRKGVNP